MGEHPVNLGTDGGKVGQIIDANGTASHLVFVSRTNAPARGANLASPCCRLAQLVKFPVQRQDQRGIGGKPQVVARNRNALTAQFLDLGVQGPRVHDHTIANDRQFSRTQNA